MKTNEIYNIDFLANDLPDKCADLIIADPPYFEVKGEFDFIWANREAYLADVERWAKECKRLLADNGTLFWWGHAKKIAYNQIILDEYFALLNNAVWAKDSCQTKKQSPEAARCFTPITERCLVYSNDFSDEKIKTKTIKPFNPFSDIIKKARIKKGYSTIQLAEIGKFYGNVNHGGSVANWENSDSIPTPQQWEKLNDILGLGNYDNLIQQYNNLRQEYETLRRPFIQTKLQTDIWEFDQQAHITGKFDHPTQKPPKLCDMIVNTSSRPNDLVIVPFAGSGSECASAAKYGRQFIGFDIEKKYCDIANKRVADILNAPTIF